MPIGLTDLKFTLPKIDYETEVATIAVSVGEHQVLDLFLQSLSTIVTKHKVMVVSNGSPEPSKQHMMDTLGKLFKNQGQIGFLHFDDNVGYPKAVAAAYKHLLEDCPNIKYVNVCNDDMIFPPNYWDVLEFYRDPRVGMAAVELIEPCTVSLVGDNEQIIKSWQFLADTKHAPFEPKLDRAVNGPWILSREVIDKVGGYIFDEAFSPTWCDDWDLYERLLIRGYYIGRTSSVYLYHWSCTTHKKLRDQSFKNTNWNEYHRRWKDGEFRKFINP